MSIITANSPKRCYEVLDFDLERALAKPSDILFVENLNRLMQERGAKNVALARHVGVAKSVVTHWRTGEIAPTIEKLSKIAEFFDVPTSALFADSTDPRSIGMGGDVALRVVTEIVRAHLKKD